MAQGCTSKDIKTPQRKSNSQKKKQTGMPSCILPARRCPRAVLAMAMCLSVCLSVCPSQAGVVSKRLDGSSSFLTQLLITGPPTHSVGARLVTVASVCRRL